MIVPQLNYNANALFLWNRNHLDYPMNSFIGHKDAILDFGWRNTGASYDGHEYDNYQLVRKNILCVKNDLEFRDKLAIYLNILFPIIFDELRLLGQKIKH